MLLVRLVLVGNNDQLVYTTANDPYTNGNDGAIINENATTLNSVIGGANYDTGHVFITSLSGLAALGGVCTANKARGVSGQTTPVNDPFDVDFVAHEIGHQFGARHTQNNDCNREPATAVEPGSDSIIMGYAGICAPDVANNSDATFHGINIQEITNFISNGAGNSCAVRTPLANNIPLPTPATISPFRVARPSR
ncbi:reprolysin-like metallopeptidase [Hymenobacter terrenus]|uniref:reprolysin-like metallopeptidase n=1 Tax=Hymenobacter terrenus TaxID=1629124 RepID=UPI0009082AC6|nr:zinc-dependent metalloprotease family protein [Hymenobacter terrenus]